MGSFKLKLVGYFLLLSVLPLAAAFWGFSAVAAKSETRRVDARLQAGLRASLAAYQERLDRAETTATTLARDPAFQRELQRRDRGSLTRMLRDSPEVYVRAGSFRIGRPQSPAASREVAVYTRNGLAGSVTAYVSYNETLTTTLRERSGLGAADLVALLQGRRILSSSPSDLTGSLDLAPGRTSSVTIGGEKYRALTAGSLSQRPAIRLAVVSPQKLIDSANNASRRHLLLGLLASLLLVAFVAYVEGRSIVRTLRQLVEATRAIARGSLDKRVPVRGRDEFAQLGSAFNEMADQLEERVAELEAERARLREAFARFGQALGATHDLDQLLRVIVETALEATGARRAVLIADDGERVAAGAADASGETLKLPLTAGRSSFGTLCLIGESFDEEQAMTAASLASHAVVALDNARLHRIVERQALVDGLTGLANRRHCEDALAAEVSRSDRMGTPLGVVFGDLDDFKAVNDIHGHAAGDAVLREVAAVLQENVRDADVAGRWGGEEFLLLLPGTDAAGAWQLAERVRHAIAARTILTADGTAIRVTCSFGVAARPPAEDGEELLAAADAALYRAKRTGKDRVEVDTAVSSLR
jgi:diguanylate cyclase (GGDEF)-like protein